MEQNYIGIRFAETDKEMIQAIKRHFPDCTLIRSDELEGAEVFFVAILPLAGFVLQLLDFILNHVVTPKKDTSACEGTDDKAKRAIVAEGKTVNGSELADMDKKQVKKTLSVKLNINFEIGVDKTVET